MTRPRCAAPATNPTTRRVEEAHVTTGRKRSVLHVLPSHRMTMPRPACTSDFDPLAPDIAAIASANSRSASGSSFLELELVELELRTVSVRLPECTAELNGCVERKGSGAGTAA